jgi:hypothetical protein
MTMLLFGGAMALDGQTLNRMQPNAAAQQPVNAAATAEIFTLAGTVVNTSFAAGQGMPSLMLRTSAGDLTVMIGPYWLLANNKFEIKAGQVVEIKAFQDPRSANTYAATEIKDTASGAVMVLRDAAGMPLPGGPGHGMMRGRMMGGARGMAGMRGMGMQGTGVCAYIPNGLDSAVKITLNGTVESVNMAAGQGSPTFTLAISANDRVTVLACQYRSFVQAGFEIAAGHHISVVAYPIPDTAGTYLAAELNNLTTGKTIRLR